MPGKVVRIGAILLPAALLLAIIAASLVNNGQQNRPVEPLPEHGNTWSIVAADPHSGSIGVAAASCFPAAIDAIAALVPGQGVAVTQADFNLGNRNRVFALLQQGRPADEIVTQVSDIAGDSAAARRQYGVVTISDGNAQVAGFTGSENLAWAGDRQDPATGVSVQGNLLESETVVSEALAAFRAATDAGDPLHERLMEALEAGSAAGGDRRCNQNGVQQTASAAMIMVAEPDQPPFAVRALGETAVGEANTPILYLSVTEQEGGANAVSSLRQQYDEWRESSAESALRLTTPLLAAVILVVLIVPIALLLRRQRRVH